MEDLSLDEATNLIRLCLETAQEVGNAMSRTETQVDTPAPQGQ